MHDSKKHGSAHARLLQADKLLRSGQILKARKLYRRICDAPKPYPLACLKAAELALRYGDHDECETRCLKALSIEPRLADAYRVVAMLRQQQGRVREAIELLEKASGYEPDNVAILLSLVNMLMAADARDKALPVVERALVINPGDINAIRKRATILQGSGKLDEAVDDYNRVLSGNPGDEYAIAGIAGILEKRGDVQEAAGMLEPLIDSGSINSFVLSAFSRVASVMGTYEKAIRALEKGLDAGQYDKETRATLYFALGLLYERNAQYDKAFETIRKANEVSRTLMPENLGLFSARAQEATVNDWIAKHPPEYWESSPQRSTNPSERPLFVVGMPRSGTTLMEQILSSHRDIAGAGELKDINDLAVSLPDRLKMNINYPDILGEISSSQLDELADSYLDTLSSISCDALRVVDKMPYNFSHVGLISLMFPNARIIYMTRDPLDTCLSIYFLKFSIYLPYTSELSDLGRYYRSFDKIMRYWMQVRSFNIMEVRYEELVGNQESVTKDIIDFCGLEWDPACLSFYETKRDVNTPSYQQVRRPMYTKSIGRWRNYEKHLGPLIRALELE